MKKILLTVSAFACALTGLVAVACDKTEEVSYKFDTMCTDVSVQDITVKKGEEFTLPTPSSRGKEWEFAGWYLTSDFSGSQVTKVVADMGTTYYAKWDRLYKITVELNGGTLAQANDLYLKKDANVKSYLKGYTPDKGTDYKFGEWQLNGTALKDNQTMPAEGITLTAKYKVAYTLGVYTQNLEELLKGNENVYDEKKETFYEYATTSFDLLYNLRNNSEYSAFKDSVNGFTQVSHAGDFLSGEIKDNPQENKDLFKIYYNRNQYTVNLSPNVEGTNQEVVSEDFYYGQVYELPYDLYTNVGYVFAGWSESSYGENDYPIDYIDAVLYNKEQGDQSAVVREKEYRVEGDATLYAYWNKGYSDLFGGADTIFLFDDASRDIYLFRSGKYFKGAYTPSNKEFIFRDKNNKRIFDGKILSDDKFCYSSTSRDSVEAQYFSRKDGLNDNIYLRLGAFNDLTYTEIDVNGDQHTAAGTYEIDGEDFIAYFESDDAYFESDDAYMDVVGKTLHLSVITFLNYSGTGFMIRNDEEYGYGRLQRFGVNGNSIGSFQLPYYSLTLDGYGNAVYYNYTTPTQYIYYYDEEMEAYNILNSSGKSQFYVRYMNEGGVNGYVFYTPSMDDEFHHVDGEDETLILDGVMNVTYKVGTMTVAKGLYTLNSSNFGLGGYIMTFKSGGTTYTFRLNRTLTSDTGSIMDLRITYTFERKPEGYAEYYYYDGRDSEGNDSFVYPMIIFNDEEAGKANIYANVDGSTVKAASASYEAGANGYYVLTLENVNQDLNYAGNKVNLKNVSELVIALDTTSTSRRVYYVYSQKDNDEPANEIFNTVEYTPSREDQTGMKLTIVGGSIAIFTEKNNAGSIVGPFRTVKRNGIDITVITGSNATVYLEINEDDHTFIRYDSAPYTAYLYREDGTRYNYLTLDFDGKGGVVYSYRESASDEATVYTGTVSEEGKTASGSQIYRFTETVESGEAYTFRFILVSDNTYIYFSQISDKEGTFLSPNSGTLVLDGTGFNLTYSDTYGNTYRNMYYSRAEGTEGENQREYSIIYTYANGGYLYFKIYTDDNTFVLLGTEYGSYIVLKNQIADGRVLEFDGQGNVKISEIVSNSGDENEEEEGEPASNLNLIATGTYVIASDGVITITYTVDLAEQILKGRLGTLQIGNYLYATFAVSYDNIADTYVNEADYSVLVLDDAGSAVRYTQSGSVERGTYTLITERYNILYYVNDAGTYATIYQYDTQKHLIVNADNGTVAYFNSSFASMMFTRFGYAIFNGTDRYYYYNDKEENRVAIYRVAKEDDDSETVNRFGFVEDFLPNGFADVINYGGDTYYINEGYNLKFNRGAEHASDYPAPSSVANLNLTDLVFLPTGTAEFSVNGTVKAQYEVDGKQKEVTYNCTVVRKLLDKEEGTYETYFMIGLYRFDIELTYSPNMEECVYDIVRLRYYIDADSYTYLYYSYMFTQMGGSASMVPFFGHITIWRDFDVEGEAGDLYMSGEFGEVIPVLDANGDSISFTQQPCEQDASGNFVVTVTHTDGYIYKGVFVIDTSDFGIPAYSMTAFYREEKLTSGNYEVTVGKIVASDEYAAGRLYSLSIADISGEEPVEIKASDILRLGEHWHIIVRNLDEDKKIESSVYYKIELLGGTDEVPIQPYTGVNVTAISDIETVYTEDGRSYADFDADDNITYFVRRGTYYIVTKTEKTEDGAYIVTTTSGTQYKITVTTADEEKTVTIELYEAE